MLFPELSRKEIDSMNISPAFLKGIFRRIFRKRSEKVFVIGFHKTGTTSLGYALQSLGFKVCTSLREGYGYKNSDLPVKEFLMEKAKLLLERFDAFQDTPWFMLYRELHREYPEAKFILTIRNEEDFIHSVQRHFGSSSIPYHEWIYGTLESIALQDSYLEIYRRHNREVREYFKNSEKFLVLELEATDKWDKLTQFLGFHLPGGKYPHSNTMEMRDSKWFRIKRMIKGIIGRG